MIYDLELISRMIVKGLNEPKLIIGISVIFAMVYFGVKTYFPSVQKAYQINTTCFAMKPILAHFYLGLVFLAFYSVVIFNTEHTTTLIPILLPQVLNIRNHLPLRLGFYGWTEEKLFGSNFWGSSSKSVEWDTLQELIFNGFDISVKDRYGNETFLPSRYSHSGFVDFLKVFKEKVPNAELKGITWEKIDTWIYMEDTNIYKRI